MTQIRSCAGYITVIAALAIAAVTIPLRAQSKWVKQADDGRIVYTHTPAGDRIPDFSYAGYHGGGVALPTVVAKATVQPSGADDTAAIQSAIDKVAHLPLIDGPGGASRGAVELAPGEFHCAGTLNLTASGVVLRGAGVAGVTQHGTTLLMTGSPHLALQIGGKLNQRPAGPTTTITDPYIPVGAMAFHVASAAGLRPGDTLLIVKPVTAAWLQFMGMAALTRNGKDEHWVSGELTVRRRIASISGNLITLDVPLMDDFDARFDGGAAATVAKVEVTGQIAEVGIEDLRVVAPAKSVALGKDPEFDGLRMQDAVDSWVQSVAFEETTNSVDIASGTERVTVSRVDVTQRIPVSTPAKPFDFSINGSQILIDRCTGRGDSVFYVATQARQEGPVVVLRCKFEGDGHIQPHQRWSTGLLVDNCDVPGGGIDLMNRGDMGTGHGWAIGWSVSWNNRAGSFVIQQPPGSENWSIGDRGSQQEQPVPLHGAPKGAPLRPGWIESSGKPVQPTSLYLAQLAERLGSAAVTAIGY
jgi:hypothetical protein